MRIFYCTKGNREDIDLNNISLTEIVKLVKLKKVSSLELTNHYIKNIEKGKKLNCFITTCFDETIKKSKTFDAKKNYDSLLLVYLLL